MDGQKRGFEEDETPQSKRVKVTHDNGMNAPTAYKQQMVVREDRAMQLIESTRDTDQAAAMPERTSWLPAPTMLLEGHSSFVFTTQFSQDGSLLASAGLDPDVLVWNTDPSLDSDDNFVTSMLLKGHSGAVLQLKFAHADATKLFTASADRTASMFDLETGERVKRYRHDGVVNSISVSRRGDLALLTGSDDCTCKLWDARSHSAIVSVEGDYQVLAVALSDDGTQAFTGGIDEVIRCYDLRKADKVLYEMAGHTDSVTGLDVSKDGRFLLSNAMDNTLRSWDIRPFTTSRSREVGVFVGHQHDFTKQLLRCAWSPDGNKVTCGSSDCFVNVWDVRTRSLLYKLPGHKGSVNEVCFHPADPIIASCGNDKQIYVGEFAAADE